MDLQQVVLELSEEVKTGKKWDSDCVSEHETIAGNHKKQKERKEKNVAKVRPRYTLNTSLVLYPGARTVEEKYITK